MLQSAGYATKVESGSWLHSRRSLANQAMRVLNMVDENLQQEGRVCTDCGEWKDSVSFFSRSNRRKDGSRTVRPICKSCTAIRVKAARQTHGERIRAQERASWRRRFHVNGHSKRISGLDWRLRKVFGLSLDQYMQMLADQDHKCDICRTEIRPVSAQKDRALTACVDHDHSTNKVRGLLCNKCNQGIGMLGDSADTVERAAAYLRRHSNG